VGTYGEHHGAWFGRNDRADRFYVVVLADSDENERLYKENGLRAAPAAGVSKKT
jgi:hypothetical protein